MAQGSTRAVPVEVSALSPAQCLEEGKTERGGGIIGPGLETRAG